MGFHPKAQPHVETVTTKAPADAIIVQDASLLFHGDFKRNGADLVISHDDRELLLTDYFKGDRKPLASVDGAYLTGKIVDALTGHVQMAQADGSASVAKIIGQVTKLTGNATVVRNGVSIILNQGDNVLQGDVVQSGSNSTLGITFIDGSVFGLGPNARMVLNEMIYDPNGSSNSSLLSLVQGTISFVAGATAKHGDMKVDTPVATMGIRGTAVLVEIDFEIPLPQLQLPVQPAQPSLPSSLPARFQILVEPDGTSGSYVLLDKVTLAPIATVNQPGTTTTVSGLGVVTFLPTATLSLDAQRVISEVFTMKFTDNANTKTNFAFTDTVIPFSTPPIKLASGEYVTATVYVRSAESTTGSQTQTKGDKVEHIDEAPSIVTFNYAMVERAGLTGSPLADIIVGAVSYADINAGDVPSISTKFLRYDYNDAAGADVTGSLTAEQRAAIDRVTVPLVVEQDPSNKNYGTAHFTYNVVDNAFDFLAVGETLVLTYTARVDSNYAPNNLSSTKTFTITITGTNDLPTIATTSNSFTERANASQPNPTGSPTLDTVSGTVTFTDVDLTDRPVVTAAFTSFTYTNAAHVPLTLTAEQLTAITAVEVPVTVTQTPGNQHDGSATWTYSLADKKFDFLATGEILTLTYTATVNDAHGGVVTRPFTVTITGTNDTPTIATTSDGFIELANASQPNPVDDPTPRTATGTVTFTDVDLTDRPVVTAAFTSFTYTNAAHVPLTLTAEQQTAIAAVEVPVTVTQTPGNTHDGSASWTYTLADREFDFLAAGEILTLTYTATVNDAHGGVITAPFTVTITGTNDTPTIATTSDGFIELANATQPNPVDDPTPRSVSGTITFTDVDLTDRPTASATFTSATYTDAAHTPLTLSAAATAAIAAVEVPVTVVQTPGNGHDGSATWTYTLADKEFDFLADGEILTLTYTAQVDDGHGGIITAPFTVTITGTNDTPAITSGAQTATIDEVAGAHDLNTPDEAFGTITFEDVDLSDLHDADVTAVVPSDTTTGLTTDTATVLGWLTLSEEVDSTDGGTGSRKWTFSAPDHYFDYLAEDEHLTLTYTVTVDDGLGGVITTPVTITVEGSNDEPVITATSNVTLERFNDPQPNPTGDPTPDEASGTISFTDLDLSDRPVASAEYTSYAYKNALNQSLTLTTAQELAVADVLSVAADGANTNDGFATWTYSVPDETFDFVAHGETLTLTYTATVNDYHGGVVQTPFTITITGSNDTPSVTSAPQTGTIEEAEGQLGLLTAADSAGGTITFEDTDETDTHSVTVDSVSSADTTAGLTTDNAIVKGWLTLGTLTDTTGGVTGSQPWTFSAPDYYFDYLAENQHLTLTYTVKIDDGLGGIETSDVTITVEGSNDAPVLTAAAPGLTTITEDETANAGQTVLSFLGASIDDVDNGAVKGIAITGTTGTHGHWEYSIDGGGTFTAIPAVSTSSALLLAPTDMIKFVPDAEDGGTDTLTYVAWDQTAGTHGNTADATVRGGSTAFSVASDTATLTVTAINDAPVNTVPGAQSADEDTDLSITGLSIADVDDRGAASITTTLSVQHGTLTVASAGGASVSGSGTASVTLTGTVAQINATLAALDNVVYRGTQDYNGSDTLTVVTSDAGNTGTGGVLGDTDQVAMTVTAVNDAPTVLPDAVAFYGFEETGSTALDTAGGHDGSIVGATHVAGLTGTALNFDGNDYVSVPDSPDWTLGSDDFSVQLWVNFNAPVTAPAVLVAHDEGPGETNKWWVSVYPTTGLNVHVNSPTIGPQSFAYSAFNPTPGQWYQVTLTKSGSTYQFYVDGQPGGSEDRPYVIPDANAPLTIGNGEGGNFANAKIDNVAIYHHALSPAEVLANYENGGVYTAFATLAAIDEDDTDPAGATVSSLFASHFSDAADDVPGGSSANTFAGVAVSGTTDSAKGAWQYSTDGGGSWTALTDHTASDAVTLAATDMLRFVPAADYNGPATPLTANLIESSATIVSGATVDLSGAGSGGTTHYSAETVQLNTAINAVNDAPVNSLPASFTTNEDTPLKLSGLSVTDVDAGAANVTVTLSVASGTLAAASAGSVTVSGSGSATISLTGSVADINAYLGNATNQPTYVPVANASGAVALTMTTNDLGNAGTGGIRTDADSININVTAVNDAPVIDSDGGGETAPISVAENSTAVTTVHATDVDSPTLTYSILDDAGSPDHAKFSIDSNTGALSFVTAPNYEAPGSAAGSNVYTVKVEASDGAGGTDVQTLTVTVTDVEEYPTYVVTTTADTTGSGSLRDAINYANSHPNTHITFASSIANQTITLTNELPLLLGDGTVIDGGTNNITISGNDQFRPFFIGDTTSTVHVTIQNLTIAHGAALGGSGGYGGGGGGAGLGGAIFVSHNASLNLINASVQNNSAAGGAGGAPGPANFYGAGGGGGGMGGAGAAGGSNPGEAGGGGGGFGIGANGGVQNIYGGGSGSAGDFTGGASAGSGVGFTGTGYGPGGPGGANGGGGGGSGYAGAGGGGGVGGGSASLGPNFGGAGGFGGGGGGGGPNSDAHGGAGGYGGGGGGGGDAGGMDGSASGIPGTGGFGGGAGGYGHASGAGVSVPVAGGFGGGNGGTSVGNVGGYNQNQSGGGGGAGMGGGIFVMDGGSLTIGGTLAINGDTVTGGAGGGGGAGNGSAFGSGIFLAGSSGTITFAPGAGQTQTVANAIADQSGSGGTAGNAGVYALTLDGAGTLVLSGINTYTGATTIVEGTLQVDGSIANSAVNVESGGKLDGNGTTGAVTVESGATLDAGDGSGVAGQLTTGSLTLQSGATFVAGIGGSAAGVGGYDQIKVNGNVSLGGATLSTSLLNGFDPGSQTFTIIDKQSAGAVSGTFAGLAEGASLSLGGHAYTISYVGGDGNDVTLTAVGLQAFADTVTMADHNAVTLSSLTANDSTTGGTAHIVSVYNAQHGTVALNGGTPIFTPDPGFSGVASFSYWISETASPTPPGTFGAATNYASGTYPQAVTIADINGDGKMDLLTSDYTIHAVGVLLGNGDGTFQNYGTLLAGTNASTPVVAADFDNDGDLDLAVGNFGSDNVSVWINNGSGSFSSATNYTAGDGPEGLVSGDLNNDGKLDLITSNYNAGTVSVLLGNGNGTFGSPQSFTAGTYPYLSALADIDSDGNLDLAVGNAGSGNVSILLGKGDGTFKTAVNYVMGANPNAVALGDVNHDGKIDMVSSDGGDGTASVRLGLGDGTFGSRTVNSAGSNAKGISLADFDEDGNLDIVVGNSRTSNSPQTNSVTVLFGNGDGTFGSPVSHATGWDTYGATVGDLNNDGRPDIVAPNELSDNVSVLLNAAPGGALSSTTVTVNVPGVSLVGQTFLGGSGDQSATAVTYNNSHLYLTYNVGAFNQNASDNSKVLRFSTAANDTPTQDFSLSWTKGDFFGVASDGTKVYAAGGSHPTTGLTHELGGGVEEKTMLATFNADGTAGSNPSPATAYSDDNFFGYSGVEFFEDVTATTQSGNTVLYAVGMAQPASYGAYVIAAYDTNGNLLHSVTDPAAFSLPGFSIARDVVEFGGGIWAVGYTEHSGDPVGRAVVWAANYDLTTVATYKDTLVSTPADFNGVAVIGSGLYAVGYTTANNNDYLIARYNTDGSIAWSRSFGGSGANMLKDAVALNGHLYVVGSTTDASGHTDGVLMEISTTDGSVISTTTYGGALDDAFESITTDGHYLYVAGHAKSFTTGANAGQDDAILLTYEPPGYSGPLTFSVTIESSGSANRVGVGDFNEDGNVDFVTTGGSILSGNGDGTFQSLAGIGLGGEPDGIAIGDLNGDDHQDIAFSNFFGSTFIALGNGDGTFQPATSMPATGSPISIQMADFNGDGKLDIVEGSYGAGSVSVFLGNGDGTFTNGPVYSEPSTVWGIAVGDFNGDGKNDMIAITDTSAFTVFLGNGDGTFNQTQYNSGGISTSVAVGDLNGDGKLDVAFSNNSPSASDPGSVSIALGNGDGTFGAPAVVEAGHNLFSVLMKDFNGDGKLDLAATDTTDGSVLVFLGNGDGSVGQPTAFAAADSTGRGLNSADVNGDGYQDLLEASQLGVSVLINTTVGAGGPVIDTDHFTVSSSGNNSPTTVLGLQVTDSNTSETLTYSAITAQAGAGSTITPSSGSGNLAATNAAIASVTYDPGATPPLTDMITFTVSAASGSDTVHFVFNQAGNGPGITLTGTEGKDVIFATESNDTLTGLGGRDQFVFTPLSSGNVQHVVTDFETSLDRLDIRQFAAIDDLTDFTVAQVGNDTVITLDTHDTIVLNNVIATNIHTSNFLFHA